MGGKKNLGENSKKVAGNAQKIEAAAAKAAEAQQAKAKAEAEDWGRGAKNSAKKDAEAAKKAELARKKAEKSAQLAEEEQTTKSSKSSKSSKSAASKPAPKKPSRGLDLAQLDAPATTLNATGIDNALDALKLTGGGEPTIEKHPERRYKAAFALFEKRRLEEMDDDGTGVGLRLNQKREKLKKEFEKSEENPYNGVAVAYDATKEEVEAILEKERKRIEERLEK